MGRKPVAPVKNTEFDVQSFLKTLTTASVGSRAEPVYKKKTSFAPSTIGYGHGRCPRYWYYAFRGAMFDDGFDYKSLGRMANGTDSHARIQALIAESGYNILTEQEVVNEDPPIRGFIDVDLVDFNIPIEVKTSNDDNYRLAKTSGHATPSHRVQTLIYMRLRGANEGLVLYENKNTNEMHIVPIMMNERNKQFIDYVFQWMRNVKGDIDDGRMPTRPFLKTNYNCKFCPVSKECWSDKDGDVDLPALEVPKV